MCYDNDSSTSVERMPREFLSSNFGRNRLQLTRLPLRYTLATHRLIGTSVYLFYVAALVLTLLALVEESLS